MENPFKLPYSRVETTREKTLFILVFGLFIFLFLFLFKPFGMDQLKISSQLCVSLGFGLVTSFMLSVFKFLIEPVVIKSNLTLGKSILWGFIIAVSIGIANYFYVSIIFLHAFILKYLLVAIWTAILVGIIPASIGYIITYNRIYKDALREASIPPEKVLWEPEVIIRAGNPKNEVRLNPRSIVYLCSNDNYVTIVTVKGDVQNKTTIRGTLKSAESELRFNNRFLRCHKCYIVNLDFVDRVSGHNQNMKIKLLNSGNEIPVSRLKAAQVNKRIKLT